MKRKTKRGKGKPGVGRQRGGIAPLLAAMLPTLAAGGKAAAVAGMTALGKYGTQKAIQASKSKTSW